MHLRSEGVPFGAHSVVGCDVDGVGGGVVAHGQTQVCNAARAVLLHQDVLGLQIPVSDSRLTCKHTTERRQSSASPSRHRTSSDSSH